MAKRRITVDLDEQLLKALDGAAAEASRSRNQFLTDTVERVLREFERQRIDAAFVRMAEDMEYQAELLQIEQELTSSSDVAWRQLDRAEQHLRDQGHPRGARQHFLTQRPRHWEPANGTLHCGERCG